jgi:hypothetical protein
MAAGSVIESGFRCWERNIRFFWMGSYEFLFSGIIKRNSIWITRMIGWVKNLFLA